MKKIFYLSVFIFLIHTSSYSQLYTTKVGYINFFSTTPLEDIKADNSQVYAVIDAGKRNMAFTLLMKSFLFAKALQQEHFNENYVESDKYPKSNFTGSYTGDVAPDKDAVYNVTVKGNLTIHGVTKQIEAPATIEVKAGHLIGKCVFIIIPEDYNIEIPSLVRGKIAKTVTVTVKIDCSSSK